MRSFALRFVLASLFLLPLAASGTYVFNTISYPGAVFTDVRAINNSGEIVGYASLDGVNFFSFSYQAGVFTALPAPPAPFAGSAHGVNDGGVIVGTLTDPAAPDSGTGFIFNAGTYALYSRPGYAATFSRAISNSNMVIGFSADIAGNTAGFIYNPFTSAFTDISVPGSFLTIAQSMNTAGQVVGSAVLSPGGARAFLREPGGTLTLFQIGSNPTRARGINDSGVITGFMTVAGVNQGFVGTSSGFETLMVPGSEATFPEGLNNAGQVAGLFTYTSGADTVTRGFIATPAAMPSGTTSSGAYTFSVAVIPNFPIFIDPPVAVGYDYAIGKGDPKIATVRLPIGIGDSRYHVKSRGMKVTLAGGELLDFRAHGFPEGVSDFTVSCIETEAMLDPHNPQAFPTELTFMAAGTFTGTMKPIARRNDMNPKQCLAE